MDNTGKIEFATMANTCVVRLEGRVTYQQGPSFNLFAESLSQNKALRCLIADLRPTLYLDSTILGILAKLSLIARNQLHSRLLVISRNEDINLILSHNGFDDIITILDHIPPTEEWRQLPAASSGAGDQAEIILEAHRALMNLNDGNRLRFRDVVDLLEQEIHPR